jgi:hypothetical protein
MRSARFPQVGNFLADDWEHPPSPKK